MYQNEMFELFISPRLEELWRKLGADKDERHSEVQTLAKILTTQYNNYIQSVEQRCNDTQNKIKEIIHKHKQSMKAFGYTQQEINESVNYSQQLPLNQQLIQAKAGYESFQKICQERITKMETILSEIKKYFEDFGIEPANQGEFSELGDSDLTRERLQRMQQQLEKLKVEKLKRVDRVIKLKEAISSLASELSITVEEDIIHFMTQSIVTKSSIESLEECCNHLKQIRADRVEQISQMAVEITHLWDLLDIDDNYRNQFLARHSTLGADVIASCNAEINRLTDLRDQNLNRLIVSQRKEVVDLWNSLHVPQDERLEIAQDDDIKTEFDLLEAEILRLKRYSVEHHDLLESIIEREKIIREYEESKVAVSDPNRLTSRSHAQAKQLMREEKARKQFKTTLPKIERKLYQMLREYKKTNGINFLWDGRPYIELLSHIERGLDNSAAHANRAQSPRRIPGIVSQTSKTLPNRRAKSPRIPNEHRKYMSVNPPR